MSKTWSFPFSALRFGLAEGLLSGITTVHNWCHNTVSPQHADAEIEAMQEVGVRGRYSYGAGQGYPNDKPMNLANLARVQKQWVSGDGMLSVGACLRTPGADTTRGAIPVFGPSSMRFRSSGCRAPFTVGQRG